MAKLEEFLRSALVLSRDGKSLQKALERVEPIKGGKVTFEPTKTPISDTRCLKTGNNRLVLPYPPSANRYWRNFKGRTVISAEARAYKKEVVARLAWLGINTAWIMIGPIAISLWVYRPRKSGDLDNRIKVILDSLQGLRYENDSQIVEIHVYRHDDKANPRVEAELRSV